MVLSFTNCTFTVAGNVFLVPGNVRMIFDNCTFYVKSTVILFHLNYSSACPDGIKFGGLHISSSYFHDGTMTTIDASPKYLFKVKSLFDINITTSTFSSLM
jgi:hypothetical protein